MCYSPFIMSWFWAFLLFSNFTPLPSFFPLLPPPPPAARRHLHSVQRRPLRVPGVPCRLCPLHLHPFVHPHLQLLPPPSRLPRLANQVKQLPCFTLCVLKDFVIASLPLVIESRYLSWTYQEALHHIQWPESVLTYFLVKSHSKSVKTYPGHCKWNSIVYYIQACFSSLFLNLMKFMQCPLILAPTSARYQFHTFPLQFSRSRQSSPYQPSWASCLSTSSMSALLLPKPLPSVGVYHIWVNYMYSI